MTTKKKFFFFFSILSYTILFSGFELEHEDDAYRARSVGTMEKVIKQTMADGGHSGIQDLTERFVEAGFRTYNLKMTKGQRNFNRRQLLPK